MHRVTHHQRLGSGVLIALFDAALVMAAVCAALLLRRLDLSAFLRRDAETDSHAQWLEARYHWQRADLSVQWQRFSGDRGSVYRTVPQNTAIELVLRYYF